MMQIVTYTCSQYVDSIIQFFSSAWTSIQQVFEPKCRTLNFVVAQKNDENDRALFSLFYYIVLYLFNGDCLIVIYFQYQIQWGYIITKPFTQKLNANIIKLI